MDTPVEIWGEDALLQWPGARQPIITERDAYMARTIWSAATGAHFEFGFRPRAKNSRILNKHGSGSLCVLSKHTEDSLLLWRQR